MSSPYPSLQTMTLPVPQIWEIKPPTSLQSALETRFCPLQTTYPGMIRFGKTRKQTPFLRFDHRWHLEEFIGDVPYRSGPFSAKVREFKEGSSTNESMDISGFCKITHLLDAYKMIQGNYPVAQHPALPSPSRKSAKLYGKLHDPHNQAYVDSIACYMLSKLRESGNSPHFSLFYGSYLGIAKQYYYNITEDFPELRFEGWFWKRKAEGQFKLLGFEGSNPISPTDPLMEVPHGISEFNSDSDDSDNSDNSDDSDTSHLDDFSNTDMLGETGSIHSASIKTASSVASAKESDAEFESDGSDASDESDEIGKELKFFAAMDEFPTMLIFLEANQDTMDSLLDNAAAVGAETGTPEWEQRWTAWLFQVIAALCQVQGLWAMTHNDLHSNNILWTPTDKEFLYYSTNDGKRWRVPTYGKLFRIIDFGRAIFTHNGNLCISDDYLPENEAGSQYNFGPLYDPDRQRIHPNPSFDLCRLSVSLFEALFDEVPEDKEDGCILSEELDRVQHETVSPLYNILWQWLIDDEGRNVLWDADQSERYPGFELYTVIAEKVKGAVPREQLDKEPFMGFSIPAAQIPEGEKVYPMFS